MKKSVLFLALLLGMLYGTQASAAEIIYSRGDSARAVGTNSTKAETYDVAQRLTGRALTGLKVKGVRITFPFATDLSNTTAWLSAELPAIKSQRMQSPDIATQEFEPRRGYTEVTFAEPYTITDEGLYVGFTFKVAKSTNPRRPLVVTSQSTIDGLWIHSSDIYRTAWHDLASEWGDLAIQVVLEGDNILEYAAGVGHIAEFKAKTGEPSSTTVEIINHGTAGIQSFDYTYAIVGLTETRHVDLPKSQQLPGIFGRSTTIEVELPAVAEKGAYPVTIDITHVDGHANLDPSHEGEGLANLFHTMPHHRAVLEEYTGTWCGYCPRGFVGLEEMARLYPEDFIGISYHNRDPMEVMSSGQFPSSFAGFPAAFIDRAMQTDAFSGMASGKVFGIADIWQHVCNVAAPAEVDVESEWTEDSVLRATALVTFPVGRISDCPYEVGFILVSDGLKGTTSQWKQANYYSGETGWPSSMDEFTKGGSYIDGLTYNFVIVARSGVSGIEGSLQLPIEEDVAQTVTYDFDIRQVVNTSGQPVIQDKNNLRVIALLFDKESGEILNANKAPAGLSSLETSICRPATTADERVRSTRLHDLQGRSITLPRQGRLYIQTETLMDGSKRTRKIIR